jgi:hypothetical protein
VKDVVSLRNMVAQSKVGSEIKLKIVRDGKSISLKAEVSELPDDIAKVSSGEQDEDLTEDNALELPG